MGAFPWRFGASGNTRKQDSFEASAHELESRAERLKQRRGAGGRADGDVVFALAQVVRSIGRADGASRRSTRFLIALTVLSVVLAFGSVGLVVKQLGDTHDAIAVQNDIALSSLMFGAPANLQIIERLDQEKPILQAHGGPMTEGQLASYLGVFEEVAGAYGDGQLSDPILCDSYSYYVEQAFGNREVQGYIREQRKIDPLFFGGLDELEGAVRRSKEANCHPSRAGARAPGHTGQTVGAHGSLRPAASAR